MHDPSRPQSPCIVIDGGASQTRLRFHGADGAPLAEARAGPSSLTLGVEHAWHAISTGLRSLGQRAAPPSDCPLVCGLAGARTPARAARFHAIAAAQSQAALLVSDGYAALIGAHGGAPGTALAVGTGVSADTLQPDGSLRSASGWGFAIGDEGGGAWIGRTALSRLTHHMDARGPMTGALPALLMEEVGTDYASIQTWLASAGPTRFATLTPIVIAAAKAGDPDAEDILSRATQALHTALQAVAGSGPVAILGGLAETFVPRLGADWPLVAPQGSALDGLYLIATGAAPVEDLT